MKQKTVGIMGALICNSNLGCVALTYSLLNLLEKIRIKNNIDFRYIIFEPEYCEEKYSEIADFLNIDIRKLEHAPVGYYILKDWKLYLRSLGKNTAMLRQLNKCDFVIDLTRGDSFTDIYGETRFLRLTKIKEIVENKGIPLILGPQTYGPFKSNSNRTKASKVIDKASVVISRDAESADYLHEFCGKDVIITTDVAFGLPYNSELKNDSEHIRIGINPSGLLSSEKNEGTSLSEKITVNYDFYINELLRYLTKKEQYEVHLIPHVGDDAVPYFSNQYDGVIAHSEFCSPVEAKNCISQMDVFIGSRMHATIGAISSGVVTIPVAYSRKFAGLFNNINYNYVIDLCSLDTETALRKTISYITQYKEIQKDVVTANKEIKRQYNNLSSVLEKSILDVIKES